MKARVHWRDYLVYLVVRITAAIFDAFPVNLNLRTARWIGSLWYRLPGRLGRHRQRALEHIRLAYGPAMSESEVRRIALESMQHWAMVYLVEMAQTARLITLWNWRRSVRLVDLGPACRLLLAQRGCVMLTPHYGNFEVLGYTLATLGFPITALMRPLDNEHLTDFVVKARRRSGLELLFKKGATARAPQVLQEGHALCFIADQDAGRKGIFADFFGRKASTYKSIGLLAMEYRVPIVVGCARRVGPGFKYEIVVNRIIQPEEWESRTDDLQWITQQFSTAMENLIRAAPEQYLWIHRRWKSRPRGENPMAPETR